MQRRLTTIVAADVAGYSRLIELDEEGTLAALRGHREALIEPLLAQHGGRVANTAGDSFLIEFPSAVEAVRCAMAVHEGMAARNADVLEDRRIRFRIGINVGDVIDQDGDLLGDGVNIAARLEAQAPPTGIVLSRSVRDQVRDKMDLNLDDLGEVEVKNITRPVRAFRISQPGSASGAEAIPQRREDAWIGKARRRLPFSRRFTWVAVLVLVGLSAGAVAFWQATAPAIEPVDPASMAYALPARPSLAVLPIRNLSGETSEDYFVEGLSEDIVTDLSKIPEIFVVAQRSTKKYAGDDVALGDVARDLGVRYILEGSARRNEARIRLNVRLIDSLSGRNVWGESYDRPVADLIEVQNDLAQQIVTAMDVELVSGALGRDRRNSTQNTDAYDLLVRGIRQARRVTSEDLVIARANFERALELDPGYDRARSWLATTYLWEARYGWADDRAAAIANAREIIAEMQGGGHAVRAVMYLMNGEHNKALAERELAVQAYPSSADAHARLGQSLIQLGRPEEAIVRIQAAMRLSPVYPIWYLGRLGDAYRLAGRTDDAVAAFERVIERHPKDIIHGRVRLVATLYATGDTARAREVAREILAIKPDFSVTKYMGSRLYRDERVKSEMLAALLASGLPE